MEVWALNVAKKLPVFIYRTFKGLVVGAFAHNIITGQILKIKQRFIASQHHNAVKNQTKYQPDYAVKYNANFNIRATIRHIGVRIHGKHCDQETNQPNIHLVV